MLRNALGAAAICIGCAPAGRPPVPASLTVTLPLPATAVTAGQAIETWVEIGGLQLIDPAGTRPEEGQGHYHVYLDDAFGPDFILESFRRRDRLVIPPTTTPGPHLLRFELLTTDDQQLRPAVGARIGIEVAPSCLADPRGQNLVITEILFDPADPRVEVTNTGPTDQSLDGFSLCQYPNYWIFPSGHSIPAGGSKIFHSIAGTNDATNLYQDPRDPLNTFGTLDPLVGGELGVYRDFVDYDDYALAAKMVAYVEWRNPGSMRESVAVAAGLWEPGQAILMATFVSGGAIANDGSGVGQCHYCVIPAASATIGSPNPPGVCP